MRRKNKKKGRHSRYKEIKTDQKISEKSPLASSDINIYFNTLKPLKIPTLDDYPELKRIIEKYQKGEKEARTAA